MNNFDLQERIKLLEYHQKLLLNLLTNPKLDFFKLIIENGISEENVNRFYKFCEEMCEKMEDQKAEGFVYFYPLFCEFSTFLPTGIHVNDVIQACLKQNLFEPLMLEFKKYI